MVCKLGPFKIKKLKNRKIDCTFFVVFIKTTFRYIWNWSDELWVYSPYVTIILFFYGNVKAYVRNYFFYFCDPYNLKSGYCLNP